MEDALVSAEAGADSVGFVFYERSKRHVTVETAASIISKLPKKMEKVGVFVNETVARVYNAVREAGLTAVQLSGDETTEFSRELYASFHGNGSKRPMIFR